eukprot:TRINITY_DN6472_c0_g1_i1.p1 TRINITY_DN6472_c0_g1~~TRINITY_DN6472_c0_g1_i1.p1  ORF type:complete len:207 (-),score=33.29 TRINITY_DN6472_c0_g1_i1:96-659(-)
MDEGSLGNDDLVPITLDLVHGSWRLKDFLLWNVSEDKITPEEFALQLCEDLQYPKAFEEAIVASMKSQLQLHQDNVRKRKHLAYLSEKEETEQRCLITLNIVVNETTRLCDQFEWDIMEPLNSPEVFARALATDLGLSREYEVSIAHSIRTQIENFSAKPELKLPPITEIIRSANLRDEFTPKLIDL